MNLLLNKVYTFNTLAPSVLGATFSNVKIEGIVTYSEAIKSIPVDTMHANIYPLLPPGAPANYKDYIFVVIRSAANIKTVLAYPWIDETSVRLITKTSLQYNIADAGEEDKIKIDKFLKNLGYPTFTSMVV
jgi:hypothetical protein